MIHRYEIGDLALVDNAKALAGTMIENGLTVYFQSSHQVWIDCGNINITEAINECLNNGIYVNSINIPHNHNKGIRIGVQEVTYHGFGEKEMFELGKILSKIFKSRKLNLYDKSILKDLIDKQNEDKEISMYNLYNLLERCFGAKKSLIKSTP